MRTLELKIPPLALLVGFAAAMWLVAWLLPSLAFSFRGQLLIAAALAGVGATISLTGVIAFRRVRTTVDPRQPARSASLVSSGIYRFSRNPMYVGFLLALAAWATHLSNPPAFLGLPAFVLYLNRFQIVPEERALRAKFGGAFAEYERSVRRWL